MSRKPRSPKGNFPHTDLTGPSFALDENIWALFAQTPLGIAITEGPEHTFKLVNATCLEIFSQNSKNLVGLKIKNILSEPLAHRFLDALNNVFKSGEPFVGHELTLPIPHIEHDKIYVDVTCHAMRDGTRKVVGLIIITEEVTERVLSRERLRESEERFRHLSESLKDQVFHVMDLVPGKITYVSPSYEKIWKSSLEELYNNPDAFLRRVHPEDRPKVEAIMDLQKQGIETKHEYRLLYEDGTVRWIKDGAYAVKDADGKPYRITGIAEDITDRKLYEERLRESEAKFRTMTDAMPQMVWSARSDGTDQYFNKRWYQFTGRYDALSSGSGWVGVIHPDDHVRARELWQKSITTGEQFEMEFRLLHHTGQYRWVLSRALPVFSEGHIQSWMGTCTDIQDMKENEEQVNQALKARDEFLSIASHELKTPLTSLKIQAQVMKRGIDQNDERFYSKERVKKLVEGMDKQIVRLTRLIDDMLDISRIRSGKLSIDKESFDLVSLVKEVAERLKPLFIAANCGAPIMNSCENAIGSWDKMRIEQVVINLLTNALRYGGGKPIHIKIDQAKTVTRLLIKDQGMGIAKENQQKIFDRFERAVSSLEISGMGLGLFIAKQIVQAHGGDIFVESELGQGSLFVVELPN